MTSSRSTQSSVQLKKVATQTLASLFYPEVILLLFLPLVISVFLVIGFFVITIPIWHRIYDFGLEGLLPYWHHFIAETGLQNMQSWIGWMAAFFPILFILLLIGLAFPIVIASNLILTSLLSSSYLVKLIGRRDFPNLQIQGSSRTVKSIINTLQAVAIYSFLWLVTLPLWIIPGAQLILPVLLTGWLNRRVCVFDALTEFANDDEFESVRKQIYGKAYVVGLGTAGFNYVPLAFFISPVFTMVAFTYFSLGALEAKRSA